MNKRLLKLVIAGALIVPVGSAFAAPTTTTTTFGASATVTSTCTVSAANLSFGNVDPLVNATTATAAQADITVTCTKGTTYDVGLDAGLATGATVTTRAMTSGANTLSYGLFSESTHTTNWGNTVNTDTVSGTGTGASQILTVYGQIPSGQNTTPAGAYTDTITVTVTY